MKVVASTIELPLNAGGVVLGTATLKELGTDLLGTAAGIGMSVAKGFDAAGAKLAVDGSTGVATAYANNLPTSWTPTVTGGGTATYTTLLAHYTRIGKLIFFTIEIVINAPGTGGGAITIALPSTVAGRNMVAAGFANGFTTFASGPVIALLNSTAVVLSVRDTSNLAFTRAHFAAAASLRITGWYQEA
jgi:hypothetical protein